VTAGVEHLSGVEHTEINQELKKTSLKDQIALQIGTGILCGKKRIPVMSTSVAIVVLKGGMIGCLTWRRYVGIVITKYTL
jgi:hypothetical protein